MATINWKSAVSGKWATAADWAGGVVPGASDDAVVDASGSYTVTLDTAQAVNSLTLNDAGATVADTAALTLGSSLTLTNGVFDLDAGGVIQGGTLSAPGGAFVWNGGTLSAVTFKGPLNVAAPLTVKDGLDLTGANGTGAGVLNLTGGQMHVAAGETLDNATLNLGSALYIDDSDDSDPNLTFGAHAHIVAKGGYIAASDSGIGVVNNGTLTANVSGGDFQISLASHSPGFVTNNGSISVSNNDKLQPYYASGVVNNGSITLNGGVLQLTFADAVTNNGAIAIVNGGGLSDDDDGAFVNAAGGSITVRGTGSVAILSGVSVSNAGAITLSGGATGYFGTDDAPWSNTGTITVEFKATLHLSGQPITTADLTGIVDNGGIIVIDTTLTNTGSVLTIGAGTADAVVGLDYPAEIVGGVIVDRGSGLQSEFGTLSGVTYDGTLDMSAANSRLFVENGFTTNNAAGTGPGKIDLTGVGAYFGAAGSETLDNATLDIGAAGAGATLALEDPTGIATVLTFGSHFRIVQTGLAAFIEEDFGRPGDAIINNGAIVAGVSGGTFDMSSKYGSTVVVRSFTNNGSIVVGNGDVMKLQPTIFTNLSSGDLTGGSYEVDAGSTLELKPVGLITADNATIILSGAGSAIQSLNMTTMTETAIDSTLISIGAAGTLEILGGRDWTSIRAFVNGGVITLGGGTFSVGHFTNNGAVSGYGVIAPAVIDNGKITASGGALEIQGAVSGAGTLYVGAGATLQVDAATTSGGLAAFSGAGGTLALGQAAGFLERIRGFAAGDTMDLVNTAATSATLAAGDKLVITDGGAAVATLRLIGAYAGDSFSVTSDGHGGTAITLATAMAAMAPPPVSASAATSTAQAAPSLLASSH